MIKLLHTSSSPHVRDQTDTTRIMIDVIIALMPATLYGIYQFKLNAALIVVVSVLTCVLSEYLFEYFMKKPITIKDCSAIVTGLILAIIIVKQLYGGLGQNFMNPALAARCFLLISFTGRMTNFVFDGVTTATPLAILETRSHYDLFRLFIGTTAGTIGETSTLMILIGGAYMLVKRVIKPTIPVAYLLSFSLFTLIFSPFRFDFYYLACQLCGGGLMLGCFFMATDYVTTPINFEGQIVFGILIGILTGLFRFFGTTTEGVSYAIILGNLVVPLIEKYTLLYKTKKAVVS